MAARDAWERRIKAIAHIGVARARCLRKREDNDGEQPFCRLQGSRGGISKVNSSGKSGPRERAAKHLQPRPPARQC
jgi:hypothetical protein